MRINALLMALGATALWASFYPIGRLLLQGSSVELDPIMLTWLRLLLGGSVGVALLSCSSGGGARLLKVVRDDWARLLWLALLGNVGEGILIFVALQYTTAAQASLLANASPIFTVLIAYFALGERPGGSRVWGMVIGFAGIGLALGARSGGDVFSMPGDRNILGNLLALGSGICWAGYTVWGTGMVRKYGGATVSVLALLLAGLMLTPWMLFSCGNFWGRIGALPMLAWLAVFYLGVMANGLGNTLWYMALRNLSAGALGAFGYISALLSLLMAMIGLHEVVSWQFVLALAMVLGGVGWMLHERTP